MLVPRVVPAQQGSALAAHSLHRAHLCSGRQEPGRCCDRLPEGAPGRPEPPSCSGSLRMSPPHCVQVRSKASANCPKAQLRALVV